MVVRCMVSRDNCMRALYQLFKSLLLFQLYAIQHSQKHRRRVHNI